MLKRVNRLRKRYQFNYVYKSGEHYSSNHLILYVSSSKTKNIKIGIAVTKKVGHAVVRNLIRRRLREIINSIIPNMKQNCNVVIVAKDTISQVSFAELNTELNKLIKKADLLIYEKNS